MKRTTKTLSPSDRDLLEADRTASVYSFELAARSPEPSAAHACTLGDLEFDGCDDTDGCDEAHEVECPTCHGHGDVHSGRYTRENPTGLVECPRCNGERYVPCDQRGDGPHVDYDLATIVSLRAEAV